MTVVLLALLSIIPCTGDLVTPNPDNDVICWDELIHPDLTGFVIYFRATPLDIWTEVGEAADDFNWWRGEPMEPGYYCVKSLNLVGLPGATCSDIIPWNSCAQWNVDIEMLGNPCEPETCFTCTTWGPCPLTPGIECCSGGDTTPGCTVQTCPPPITADWPSGPCTDPGVETP